MSTTDTVTQEWMEATAIKKKICEELEKIFERYVDRLWEEDVKELNNYKPLIFPSVPKEDRANLEQGR